MVHRTIQQCCKSRSSREPIASHIWIGDAILATQWAKFTGSVQVRTSAHFRSFGATTSARRQRCANNRITISPRNGIIVDDGASYTSRRHGSATPGPLEARKRRALQKHMTGAANLGMFGSGLDFSGSSSRIEAGRAGKGMNTKGDSLYEALGMIWRWWLLDPDAPVRHDNGMMPDVQEDTRPDSFTALLQSLDISWGQKPETIIDLLEGLSSYSRPDQTEILQRVCSWVTAEVFLGSMTERHIDEILWSLAHPKSADTQPTHGQQLMVCQSIAEGVLRSTVRPLKDLPEDTVWLLLRSLATVGSYSKDNIEYMSKILQSLAWHHPAMASKMLSSIFDIGVFRNAASTQSHVLKSLRSLTGALPAHGVLAFAQSLTKSHKIKQTSSSMRRLKTVLEAISASDLAQRLRDQHDLNEQRLQFERELLRLDMGLVAAYLQHASETEVCKYVMEHVVGDVKGKSIDLRRQKNGETTTKKFKDHPTEYQTYSGLLHLVEENHPQRMRSTLQFVLSFLRMSERMSECYNLNCYLFSRKGLRGRVSIEFLHKEVELWAQKHPLFAVILLASDRRRGIMHHPVVARVLHATKSSVESIPRDIMYSLATTLIDTHRENLKIATLKTGLQNDSSRILQLLLEPLAWGQCDERRAFRKAQEIIKLLGPIPGALHKESSVAVTNIVAIKTLEARCKVPEWKLEWLAPIVTQLEGSEVWAETCDRIKHWWRMIEEEEYHKGRIWKDGVGWVSR